MNSFGIAVIFAIAAQQVVVAVDPKYEEHWEKYKKEHGKNYGTEEEERQRGEHFVKHIQKVAEHNAKYDLGLESYQMSVNHPHADKPFAELKRTVLGAIPPSFYNDQNRTDFSKRPSPRAVTTIDWTKGTSRVTSVKNQGSCGSCWAFATAGALEGQFYTCNRAIQDLSIQYILDCASPPVTSEYGIDGCDGGWPLSAMSMVEKKGGLPLLSDYPYTGKMTKSCPGDVELFMPLIGRKQIGPKGDENAVANALKTKGPLSIAIEVDENMANYKRGIYSSSSCNTDVNHAVLLVGTGTENGKDYWKIKNSWGTNWGESGYIRIQRNAGNMCLVAHYAAYPIPDCSQMK